MDNKDIQNCISDVFKQRGLKIRSIQRNPLTSAWQITVFERNDVFQFRPTPSATTEECAQQLRKMLGLEKPVLKEEIENLRLRTPDNIFAAMQRLKDIGEDAVEPLIELLLNKNESNLFRRRVADTLAMIGSARAIAPLIQALNDEDVGVRSSAIRALAEIGDESAIGPLERLVAFETGIDFITPTLQVSLKDKALKAIQQISTRIK